MRVKGKKTCSLHLLLLSRSMYITVSHSITCLVVVKSSLFMQCVCYRAKGKPPVGGVSIFGGVTDDLIGGASTEPEESTISSAPPAPSKPAVISNVSIAYTYVTGSVKTRHNCAFFKFHFIKYL